MFSVLPPSYDRRHQYAADKTAKVTVIVNSRYEKAVCQVVPDHNGKGCKIASIPKGLGLFSPNHAVNQYAAQAHNGAGSTQGQIVRKEKAGKISNEAREQIHPPQSAIAVMGIQGPPQHIKKQHIAAQVRQISMEEHRRA